MILIEESPETQIIIEGVGKDRTYSIAGIFMQAEKKNRNGRIYPLPLLMRECDRYNSNYILKNRAMGELNHPDKSTINLDRVSHLITELRADGNNFVGKAKIIDTPCGKIVKNLLDSGIQLGVSTRGIGSLKPGPNGVQMVDEDFYLATVDIVADPSAPEAFVRGIMENKEFLHESTYWSENSIEEAKKSLKEASRQDYEARALRIFQSFLSKI